MNAVPKSRLGSYVSVSTVGEAVKAFMPPPLPPDPPVRLHEFHDRLDRANQALGRLDGIRSALPDPGLFLYMYVRKEALLSSQIEGTQFSLAELLRFENDRAPGVPVDADAEEVSNCVNSLLKIELSGAIFQSAKKSSFDQFIRKRNPSFDTPKHSAFRALPRLPQANSRLFPALSHVSVTTPPRPSQPSA